MYLWRLGNNLSAFSKSLGEGEALCYFNSWLLNYFEDKDSATFTLYFFFLNTVHKTIPWSKENLLLIFFAYSKIPETAFDRQDINMIYCNAENNHLYLYQDHFNYQRALHMTCLFVIHLFRAWWKAHDSQSRPTWRPALFSNIGNPWLQFV